MSKYQCWLIEQIMNSSLIHLIKSQLCQTNQTKELPDDVAKIPLNIDDNRVSHTENCTARQKRNSNSFIWSKEGDLSCAKDSLNGWKCFTDDHYK